jgi:hypothetical protein
MGKQGVVRRQLTGLGKGRERLVALLESPVEETEHLPDARMARIFLGSRDHQRKHVFFLAAAARRQTCICGRFRIGGPFAEQRAKFGIGFCRVARL